MMEGANWNVYAMGPFPHIFWGFLSLIVQLQFTRFLVGTNWNCVWALALIATVGNFHSFPYSVHILYRIIFTNVFHAQGLVFTHSQLSSQCCTFIPHIFPLFCIRKSQCLLLVSLMNFTHRYGVNCKKNTEKARIEPTTSITPHPSEV